jgi:hypothetical protein
MRTLRTALQKARLSVGLWEVSLELYSAARRLQRQMRRPRVLGPGAIYMEIPPMQSSRLWYRSLRVATLQEQQRSLLQTRPSWENRVTLHVQRAVTALSRQPGIRDAVAKQPLTLHRL